jgi:hypothetical protein
MNRTFAQSLCVASNVSLSHAGHSEWRLLRPSILAMRSRLAAHLIPCAAVTFFIAGASGALLGDAKLPTFLITFAWSAAVVHQFLATRRPERVEPFRWSRRLILNVLGGQLVWVMLRLGQGSNPDAWYGPLTMPPALIAIGAIVALCWPLHPFIRRPGAQQGPARDPEVTGLILLGSFFLLSGNLVFAAGACISVVTHFARRAQFERNAQSTDMSPMLHVNCIVH